MRCCSGVSSPDVELYSYLNPNTMAAELQGSEESKMVERSLNSWTLHHLWGFGGQIELVFEMYSFSPAHPLTLGQEITSVLTTVSVGMVKALRQPSLSSHNHNQHQLLYVKLWPPGTISGSSSSSSCAGTLINRLSHV